MARLKLTRQAATQSRHPRSDEPAFSGEREPDVIEQMLPPEHREAFRREYREGYARLRIMLRRWRMAAEVYADPAFQAESERSRRAADADDRTGYVPWDEALHRPTWP